MKRLAIVIGLAGSGCVISEPSVATGEAPIIGGVTSPGAQATVLLAGFPSDRTILHSCSAIVVSPTVLLTSAHCVDAPTHPGYLYGVFVGDDATPYPTLVELEPQLKAVASVHPHPQYSPQLPFYADIATVVLAAPLAIAPAPLQRTAIDATIVGKQARIVGYGQTVYGEYNAQRHEAMTMVASIEEDTIVVGDVQKRACLGDSGGPAIVDGVVVGVDSYGPVGCDAPAHYRRVDKFMPFISQYVPAPEPDPDPTPDPMPMPDEESGGCAASHGASAWLALGALGLLLLRRRRR